MRKRYCDDKQGKNKGAWSKHEDQILIDYITTHGEGCWRALPKAAGLQRCGKSCRLRWINYLRPDIKRGNFAQDEEDLIIKLHALLGNRWSLIAGRLPGRTDNEVKNYWNSHIKKKLINMGIDPNNHRLNQIPLPPPPPPRHHHYLVPVKPKKFTRGIDNSNDRVSDAASCLEDDNETTTSGSSHLNLDLTIAAPSSADLTSTLETPPENGGKACEVQSDVSPTLLLFI